MFRRLFPRLLAVYLAITLIIILVLGVAVDRLFYAHFYRERQRFLLARAAEIQELTAGVPDHRPDGGALFSRGDLYRFLRLLDRSAGARIWLIGPGGRVLNDSRPGQPRYLSGTVRELLVEPALGGETVSRVLTRPENQGEAVVAVAIPVDLGGRRGAAVLMTPVADLSAPLSRIRRLIWLSTAVAAVLAVPLLYFISRRMTAPLQSMHRAALALAEGDFAQRVPAAAGDEVGELGKAFNLIAARLQRLENTRRDFIATVSHELRTPLTSMLGFVQGMMDGTIAPDSFPEYLGRVHREIRRLTGMVEELLDLARVQAGQAELELEPVDLAAAARETLERIESLAGRHGVQISSAFTAEPVWVMADRRRLAQILLNLLDNAVKFTPVGGMVRLTTSLRRETGVVTVSDSGPGIPPEELPHVWERFYKGDRDRTPGAGGSSVGRALVRELVEANGGRVAVESTVGKGATFSVFLPLAPAPRS